MARNYAALPHEYLRTLAILTNGEFGQLIRALLSYSETGNEEKLTGRAEVLWAYVKSQEDRYQDSYDSASNTKSEAGKKGAAKRWQRIADNGTAWQGMAEDSKNGYTETETNTETNTNLPLASASREDSAPARKAAFLTEEETAKVMERKAQDIQSRLVSGEPVSQEMLRWYENYRKRRSGA